MADALTPDFSLVPGADAIAVGSRSLQRATEFATRHQLPKAYGSYAELLADPDLDAVYIATPHPQHTAVALDALAAGKHILVEKAFTASVDDTAQVITAAREAGLFAMEAMWTRFIPAVIKAKELVDAGAIGELRMIQGDLAAFRAYDPNDRLFAPELGGGAVLDVGVYPISLAHWFFGTPDVIRAHGNHFPNGVDASAAIMLGWEDGRSASLLCALECPGPGRFALIGTAGWIDIPPRFHHPKKLVLYPLGQDAQTIELPITGGGYYGELKEATEAITAGRTESEIMPLADTLAIQQIMAEVLLQI